MEWDVKTVEWYNLHEMGTVEIWQSLAEKLEIRYVTAD